MERDRRQGNIGNEKYVRRTLALGHPWIFRELLGSYSGCAYLFLNRCKRYGADQIPMAEAHPDRGYISHDGANHDARVHLR
jgi:hypothetical protein